MTRLITSMLCLVSVVVIAAEDAPVSLTASDGTGLKLVKLQARAVVTDPLAFTELTLTFQNPLDRVLEGQFKVMLPQGATVSRFAMKWNDRWQEGEVVEKRVARRAYEDFLHRRPSREGVRRHRARPQAGVPVWPLRGRRPDSPRRRRAHRRRVDEGRAEPARRD